MKILHMKLSTYFLILAFLFPLLSFAQTPNPVFNWKQQEISADNILRGMTVASDGSAVIAGYQNTLKKTTDNGSCWNNIPLIDPLYNFSQMSIQGKTGYIVTMYATIVDNPKGGEKDVRTNGLVLKTVDGGKTWNALSLTSFGEGEDPGLNPSLAGNYEYEFKGVKCIDDQVAYLSCRWKEYDSGDYIFHKVVFK